MSPEANEDSQPFAAQCAMRRDGALLPGRIQLEDGSLYFRSVPVGPKNRPVAWALPADVIDRSEFEGGVLTLHVGRLRHVFEGEGLAGLHARLSDDPNKGRRPTLLEGNIQLYRNRLMTTRGRLTLTDFRLRFEPASGLDIMLLGDLTLDIDIDEIDRLELAKVQRQLEIKVGNNTYRFLGALAPRMHGVLVALRGDTVTVFPNEVVFTWQASLCRGPVELKGELTATRRRIRFHATGAVDALLGVQEDVAIKLVDLTRVELRGRIDRRIVLHEMDQEFVFALPDAEERFSSVQELLIEVCHESEPLLEAEGARERSDEIDRFLQPWGDKFPKLLTEPINLLAQALDKSREGRVRRGWLCAAGPLFVFLPAGGPTGGERPLAVPLFRLSRAEQGMAPAEHLYFGVSGTTLRFAPQGGDAVVDAFWPLWQEAVDQAPAIDRKKPWSGPTAADPFNRRDVYRTVLPTGWIASLRAATEADFATVADAESPAGGLGDDGSLDDDGPPTHGNPGATTLGNPGSDRSSSSAPQAPLRGTLSDLSHEGCALILDEEYGDRSEVITLLPGREQPLEVPGRLVYSHKIKLGRHRHGIAFEGVSAQVDEWLREIYMDLQRTEIAQQKAKWSEQRGETPTVETLLDGASKGGGILDPQG